MGNALSSRGVLSFNMKPKQPLVFAFHGLLQSYDARFPFLNFGAESKLVEAATEHGCSICFPQASRKDWTKMDTPELKELVEQYRDSWQPSALFLFGFSDGCLPAHEVTIASKAVSAMVVHSGSYIPGVLPDRTVSIMVIGDERERIGPVRRATDRVARRYEEGGFLVVRKSQKTNRKYKHTWDPMINDSVFEFCLSVLR